jgi:hypothetical protein
MARPWRIHEIAQDFRLEDVWALPTPGGPDDFPVLVGWSAALDPAQSSSFVARNLFAIRWKLGELFGWDDEASGVGARVPSLMERLPDDLRKGPRGPEFDAVPFNSVYLTENEFAAETANGTVQGILHLGWVPDDEGGYRGEMAVYVKPNGLLGEAYMKAILPFRYLLVYPGMMRELERKWPAVRAQGSVTGLIH